MQILSFTGGTWLQNPIGTPLNEILEGENTNYSNLLFWCVSGLGDEGYAHGLVPDVGGVGFWLLQEVYLGPGGYGGHFDTP